MPDDKVGEKEFYELADGLVMDLIAVFQIIEDEYMATLQKGIKEGWTPERMVQEMEKIV